MYRVGEAGDSERLQPTVSLLAVSTILGIIALLVPDSWSIGASVAGLVGAILGLAARVDRLRGVVFAVLVVGALLGIIGLFVLLIATGAWATLIPLAGVLALSVYAWSMTGAAARNEEEPRWWWQRRSMTEAHLAMIREMAESQTESIELLKEQVASLECLVVALREELGASASRSRRSNLLSFWGGAALSIPIGVLINLATSVS